MSEGSILVEAKRPRARRAALRAAVPAIETARIRRGVTLVLRIVLRDEAGRVLEASAHDAPVRCVQGAGDLLGGLERALEGRAVGEVLRVVLAPEDAHGVARELPLLRVPRAKLPPEIELRVGAAFEVLDPIVGLRSNVWLHSLEETHALLQREHPLAGRTLDCEIEILAVEGAASDRPAEEATPARRAPRSTRARSSASELASALDRAI
jgi:FKBP-type peptidyl-prolyl cis-trans isomerase SlyD